MQRWQVRYPPTLFLKLHVCHVIECAWLYFHAGCWVQPGIRCNWHCLPVLFLSCRCHTAASKALAATSGGLAAAEHSAAAAEFTTAAARGSAGAVAAGACRSIVAPAEQQRQRQEQPPLCSKCNKFLTAARVSCCSTCNLPLANGVSAKFHVLHTVYSWLWLISVAAHWTGA